MNKFNYYNGLSAASIFLAVLVVGAELFGPLKTLLGYTFSHHWIGKAVLITVVFILVGFFYKRDKLFGINDDKFAWYSTLLVLIIILVFFIIHYFL